MTTDILGMLGAGSGINIQELSENLTAAERAPRQAVIDRNIERTEAKIGGLSVLALVASGLRDAFAKLKDTSDFNQLDVRNSAPSSFALEPGVSALPGRHSIEVLQLAQPQQTASAGFAAKDSVLHGGAAFSLSLTVGSEDPVDIAIGAGATTPQGVVSAINAAGTGVTAQLLNTGSGATPWRIVLTSTTGEQGAFTVTSTSADVDFSTVGVPPTQGVLQSAQDAAVTVNGLTVTRASNTLTDVIPGATLQLYGSNAGSPATVDLTRNTTTVVDSIRELVVAHNDAKVLLDELGRRDGGEETFSGALAGQPLLRQVTQQVRNMFARDSSTPSGDAIALRDLGIAFDRNGRLELDEVKLAAALDERYDDVRTMFTAGTDNQSTLGTANRGLAGDAHKQLDDLLRFTGAIRSTEQTLNSDLDRHRVQLEALEVRMEKVLQRNLRQFSAMDSLVSQLASMREQLAVQFENMSYNLRGD